jgi:hypothetical protein
MTLLWVCCHCKNTFWYSFSVIKTSWLAGLSRLNKSEVRALSRAATAPTSVPRVVVNDKVDFRRRSARRPLTTWATLWHRGGTYIPVPDNEPEGGVEAMVLQALRAAAATGSTRRAGQTAQQQPSATTTPAAPTAAAEAPDAARAPTRLEAHAAAPSQAAPSPAASASISATAEPASTSEPHDATAPQEAAVHRSGPSESTVVDMSPAGGNSVQATLPVDGSEAATIQAVPQAVASDSASGSLVSATVTAMAMEPVGNTPTDSHSSTTPLTVSSDGIMLSNCSDSELNLNEKKSANDSGLKVPRAAPSIIWSPKCNHGLVDVSLDQFPLIDAA